MEKLDLTKAYKSYFTAKTQPEIVDIAPATFLSITGKGDPSGSDFAEKIQSLYGVAYAIKFICKARQQDFAVSKLEGLWHFDEAKFGAYTMEEAPLRIPRQEWEFRLLIRMPDFVTASDLETAKATVAKKKASPLLGQPELFALHEGKCVQMLHVGPFSSEPESLAQMMAFMQSHHFKKNGLHHEIYLSDFRKTAPEKLKTILREPVC